MAKLARLTAVIILLLTFTYSLAHAKDLNKCMTKLIDTAVLNNISLTFGRFYLSTNEYDKVSSVKFNVYVKGKGFWILQREWEKLGGKTDGITFSFDF